MHQLAAEDKIQPVTSSTTGSGVTGNDTVPHGGTGTILDLLGNGEEGGQEGEGEEDERRQEVQNNQVRVKISHNILLTLSYPRPRYQLVCLVSLLGCQSLVAPLVVDHPDQGFQTKQ